METRSVEPNFATENERNLIPLHALLDSEPDVHEERERVDEWGVVDVSEESVLDSPLQPKHSVRSEQPGPKGCWALNTKGVPCGAAKLRDGDYCAAHSGVGLASNPALYAPVGNEASRRTRAAQARLRLELGITRPNSPRGHLRARVFAERERLAIRAVEGGLDDPRLALALIREVDPAPEAELSVSMPASIEDVKSLSLSQLLALGKQLGIETPPLPGSSGSSNP